MAYTTVTTLDEKSATCTYRSIATRYTHHLGQNGAPSYLLYSSTDTTQGNLGTTKVDRTYKRWDRDSLYWSKLATGIPLSDRPFTFERLKRLPGRYAADLSLGNYSGSWYSSYTSHDARWYTDWTKNPSDLPIDADLNHLKSKLLKKQRGDYWQAPLFFLEGRQAASMVAQRAGDLTRLLRQLRRGNVKEFLHGLRVSLTTTEMDHLRRAYSRDRATQGVRRAGANLWLETWFGWVPFLSDIYDAIQALESLYDLDSAFIGTTRAQVRNRENRVGFDSGEWGGEAVRYYSPREDSRRAVWRWKPTGYTLPAKLGLTNPLSIAWNRLPLSFVADWIIPMGNYLDTLDAPFRVQHVGGTWGLRRYWIVTERLRNKAPSANPVYSGIARSEQVYVDRSAMTALPVPSIDMISLHPRLGAWHAVTSISLLTQTLGWFKS